MSKIKKSYRFSEEITKKIEELSKEKDINNTAAVELMVNAYFADRSVEHLLLRDTLAELMDEKLAGMKEDLKRVRLTGNVIDRNTQMQNEFWNHSFIVGEQQSAKFASTKAHKTMELKEAEAVVLERIAEGRKRNWENRGSKSGD